MTTVHQLSQQIQRQSVPQLKQTYAAYKGEPARSNNREWLTKQILWAAQAAVNGGLSERARARASELAEGRGLRQRPPQQIPSPHDADGTSLRLVGAGSPRDSAPHSPTAASPSRAASGLPPVGSVITREYRGRRLEVQVVADGFVYDGAHFRSLSAVARHITGTTWNGHLFFGLRGR